MNIFSICRHGLFLELLISTYVQGTVGVFTFGLSYSSKRGNKDICLMCHFFLFDKTFSEKKWKI